MTLINNSRYLGTKIMKKVKYSLNLNKVRKNLAGNSRSPATRLVPGKLSFLGPLFAPQA